MKAMCALHMKKNKPIGVIGGDMRQIYLCSLLRDERFDVLTYGLDKFDMPKSGLADIFGSCEYVMFPLPASIDKTTLFAPFSRDPIPLSLVMRLIKEHNTVLAGSSGNLFDGCGAQRVVDYYKNEGLQIKNALLTAEGAIEVIMRESPRSIDGLGVLVTGYGRIGRQLSQKLHLLNARVTVAARKKEDLIWAEASGLSAVHIKDIGRHAGGFDVIVNTPPSLIIDSEIINLVRKDCLIVDLSSSPFGVDFDYARQNGVKAILASSLPGKSSPYTAAVNIKNAILDII